MRHIAFVLLLIPGDLLIVIGCVLFIKRYVNSDEIDRLPPLKRLLASNLVASAIGLLIVVWSGLLYLALWN